MCGILGAVKLDAPFSEIEKSKLSDSLKMIAYRGPDASNEKMFSSKTVGEHNIYLGHRRLSIIDLSEEGTQPLTNDNKVYITFNGEIYNYVELREELLAKGVEFKTKTDTEVIINLYKTYGIEGFSKLNGMWAFMIYDQENQKLILSRDRFSIKPLYLYNKDGFWVFSSEIKQIIPFLDAVEPNLNVLGNYLNNYIVDYSNDTFFKGITKLPPKNTMVLDLQSHEKQVHKYWDFEINDSQKETDEKDLIEEFKHLFEDSVKIRLRSDVKVGNTLSGGLDSSSIAVTADKINNSKLMNLSVVTDNKKHSEEKYVDILHKENGTNITKLRNDKTNPWQTVEKVIWHNDEPILSLSTIAHFNMMASFKKNTDITVILSGQGGDETLAGYNKYYFYNLIQAKNEKKYFKAIKEAGYILPKFLGEFQLNSAKRYIPFLSDQYSILDKVGTLEFDNVFKKQKFDNFIDRQILDIDKFSVPALTHYEDRSSMHKSLEIRLPFLDYRLVNFNLNLPTNMKIRNGFSKFILRKAIDSLPEEVAWRRDKKGFNIDEKIFYDETSTDYINSLFENSILEKWGVIDAKEFLIQFNLFINGSKNYWVRNINRIIFAEIWARKFFT